MDKLDMTLGDIIMEDRSARPGPVRRGRQRAGRQNPLARPPARQGGRRIPVRARPTNETAKAKGVRGSPPDCRVFVGNLPFEAQWRDLKDACAPYGTVLRADVEVGTEGRSKGFGTVVFSSRAEAQACIRGLAGSSMLGRNLVVHKDVKKGQNGEAIPRRAPQRQQQSQPSGFRVYVGNLPFSMVWQELKEMGRQIGAVQRADLAVDASGRSRGFGVLTFSHAEDAFKCIATLNKSTYQGRELFVKVDEQAIN